MRSKVTPLFPEGAEPPEGWLMAAARLNRAAWNRLDPRFRAPESLMLALEAMLGRRSGRPVCRRPPCQVLPFERPEPVRHEDT
jgi:hypothetical protein